jgi:glucose/arabinose dehydrogenase
MSRRRIITILGILLALLLLAALAAGPIKRAFFKPTASTIAPGAPGRASDDTIALAADNLSVPWGVAFLPGGDLLVTERSGTLRRIGSDKQTHTIQGVTHIGEGGLMGLALDPKFAENNQLYMYMTTRTGDALTNRIERYVYRDGTLSGRQVILQNIPGERNHDGGRLAFGPDGYLYVTTGDAGREELAQDRTSLAGKILRLTTDGAPAPGNPFGNAVYSYGHRNPQGLAWDDKGRLWSTEHGPSGSGSGFDELNLITSGSNYGWPEVQGDETRSGMTPPVAHSGAEETWAPGGLAYADGVLYLAGLRGQTLYAAVLTGDDGDKAGVPLKAYYAGQYGRLRTTAVHGGNLYLTTSNTDGRGEPKDGDDRILRIPLQLLRAQ